MIKLFCSYPYDNNYDYSKSFSTKSEQTAFFNTLDSITINPYDDEDAQGYIKENESFCVNYNYDYLVSLGVNYLSFKNGDKEIYAFIVNKVYENDEVTRLIYEVDVLQTFMFDFTVKKSFVERKKCTIEEITDFDEGIEMGEHIVIDSADMFIKGENYYAMFSGFRDYKVTNGEITEIPYYSDSKPLTKIDGIYYPFMLIALDTDEGVDAFYKYLVDMPNLLGIIRFPACAQEFVTLSLPIIKIVNNEIVRTEINCPKVVKWLSGVAVQSYESVSIPKQDITDFYPYTYYVMTDGETEPLIMQPQYLEDSLSVKYMPALSHTPVERYYPNYYKGDTTGRLYNITNSTVMMLPVGTNGGLETISASINQIEQQKNSALSNVLMGTLVGAVGLGVGALTGGLGFVAMGAAGLAGGLASGYNSIQEQIARNRDLELTPSTIKSYGTPSTRNAFGNNIVRVIKYSIKDAYKNRILSYTERYGNKFNNYAELDLKTYKGFVKYLQPNIDSKIDNMYIKTITNILERGVYFE